VSELSGALCVGQYALFDSTHPADHAEARDLCARCPALLPCALLLREVQTATLGVRSAGGGPAGTWAGKLVGKPKRHAECGTDSGYHRHLKIRNEDACGPCLRAHAAAGRKVAS
jgi:hypothetical protein